MYRHVPVNPDRVPQQDMTLQYASIEQVDKQNTSINVLTAQINELARAQQTSNETANILVARIATMMEAIDASTQKLNVEAQTPAAKSKSHSESIDHVQNMQQHWWHQTNTLYDSHQQHHAELWEHRQRLQDLSQRRNGVNDEMHGDPASGSRDTGRRQSMPSIPVKEEVLPPPLRMTTVENAAYAPSTVVYSQISDPPSFDENRYEDWKKAIQWWQEINAGTDQNRLLATLGMRAKGSLEIVLQEYLDRTKMVKPTRSIDSFVLLMDEKFRRPTEELVLLRVEQWNEMKRKSAEGFKAYWIRLERLHHKLTDLGIVWPEKVAFRKAFTSLCMSREHQTLTRAALEMSPQKDSILELKRLTVKLFDNQRQDVGEVCLNEDVSEAEDDEECIEWGLQAARAKSSKNRGGDLQKSITSTQNLYGMKGGSKGVG